MKVGLPRWRGIGCMKASRTSSARCMEMLMWLLLQSLIPVVMSGIIAVYGLVISVLIVGDIRPDQQQSLYKYALLKLEKSSFMVSIDLTDRVTTGAPCILRRACLWVSPVLLPAILLGLLATR